MTTLTSPETQHGNFGSACKRRLSGARYLILEHWLVQFAIVMSFIFFQGLNTPHGLVTLQLAPQRMAQIFGDADSGSYLKAALSLIAKGQNTPEWAWVLNLWPPGMVWLDAGIIRFSPLDYGVTIGLITALLWSATLSVLTWPFMRRMKPAVVVLLVELAILGTSPFQSWMFDEGLFYADGLGGGLVPARVGSDCQPRSFRRARAGVDSRWDLRWYRVCCGNLSARGIPIGAVGSRCTCTRHRRNDHRQEDSKAAYC